MMDQNWRPEVVAFANAMEAKLRKNDAERGSSWKSSDILFLFGRLFDETGELQSAWVGRGDVLGEAADVANFAMMIADRLGALREA